MTGAGNVKIGQAEERGNREGSLNGDQVKTKKRTGGMANRRYRSEGRRMRADAGV
jgi:hypothetical protein